MRKSLLGPEAPKNEALEWAELSPGWKESGQCWRRRPGLIRNLPDARGQPTAVWPPLPRAGAGHHNGLSCSVPCIFLDRKLQKALGCRLHGLDLSHGTKPLRGRLHEVRSTRSVTVTPGASKPLPASSWSHPEPRHPSGHSRPWYGVSQDSSGLPLTSCALPTLTLGLA